MSVALRISRNFRKESLRVASCVPALDLLPNGYTLQVPLKCWRSTNASSNTAESKIILILVYLVKIVVQCSVML